MLPYRFSCLKYAVLAASRLCLYRQFHTNGSYIPSNNKLIPMGSTETEEPEKNSKRILERDIKIILLEAHKLADRAYTNVQEQLQCVGGSAISKTKYYPTQVQCVNVAVDDLGNVNWICKPVGMHKDVKITTSRVSFEGWDYPGDKYVRAGSAVVRYELDWVGSLPTDYSNVYVYVCVIAGIIVCFYLLTPSHPAKIQADTLPVTSPKVEIHEIPSQPDVHVYKSPVKSKVYIHETPSQPDVHVYKSPVRPKVYVHETPSQPDVHIYRETLRPIIRDKPEVRHERRERVKENRNKDDKIFFAKSTPSE